MCVSECTAETNEEPSKRPNRGSTPHNRLRLPASPPSSSYYADCVCVFSEHFVCIVVGATSKVPLFTHFAVLLLLDGSFRSSLGHFQFKKNTQYILIFLYSYCILYAHIYFNNLPIIYSLNLSQSILSHIFCCRSAHINLIR